MANVVDFDDPFVAMVNEMARENLHSNSAQAGEGGGATLSLAWPQRSACLHSDDRAR